MRYLQLSLLAFAAHAAPGYESSLHAENIQERAINNTTELVDLSLIEPFEPWPGYFNGTPSAFSSRSLDPEAAIEKRSTVQKGEFVDVPVSVEACKNIWPSPQNQGWQFGGATCDRQNPNGNGYTHDCTAKADFFNRLAGLTKECAEGLSCMEFHGRDAMDSPTYDISCVGTQTMREWTIDAIDLQHAEVCSVHYANKHKNGEYVNMSLQTNVLDSAKLNRIEPANIYYKLGNSDAPIGTSRVFDADVGSGIVTVPHGDSIQACVKTQLGQKIIAIVGLTALMKYMPSDPKGGGW